MQKDIDIHLKLFVIDLESKIILTLFLDIFAIFGDID